MGRATPRLSRCLAGRLTGLSWPARAVLVWGLLAGLFLMHGAASPLGCCQDGPPVTAMAVVTVPLMPHPAMTGAITHTGRSAGVRNAATHAAPTAASHTTAATDGSSCRGGMLCSSRQPRETRPGALTAPLARMAVFTAAAVPPHPAPAYRSARPPGRPGLPLPLFLGVSRT